MFVANSLPFNGRFLPGILIVVVPFLLLAFLVLTINVQTQVTSAIPPSKRNTPFATRDHLRQRCRHDPLKPATLEIGLKEKAAALPASYVFRPLELSTCALTLRVQDDRNTGINLGLIACIDAPGLQSVESSPPNSPKLQVTITDRNTTDNTCTCVPGCH
jgi:hypothetical protein